MAANLRLVESPPVRVNIRHVDQDLVRARRGRRVFGGLTVAFTIADLYIQTKVPLSIYTVGAIAVNMVPAAVTGHLHVKIDQLSQLRRSHS